MKMIQQINRDVLALDNNELLRTAVVFPSRRAALLFQKEFVLAKGSDCTWMPTLITVNEFYLQSLQRVKSDELELLTVLHQVYQNYWKDLDFGSFMNLGKIILSDFDAIDRYLVDAKLLYRNLKEWKDIEEVFDEGWEKFTQQLDNSKSIIGTALEKIWEKMYSIYSDFQLALQKADLQYTGKNLLELHNEIYHNEKFKLPFDHVFVCGLNALSTSELQIWKKLSADGIAHTYWMTDNLFTDVAFITAGKFQKKAKNIFNGVNDHWTASDMFQHPKNIVIKECSSRVVLNQVVSNFIAIDDEQKRLIVLADESKLTDLVNHITPQLDQVNITMGYPVSSTHVYSFLDTTVAILRNVVIRDNRIWFKDSEKILQLIHHPWIDKDIRQAILESLHQYANYLEVDDFKNLFIYSMYSSKTSKSTRSAVLISLSAASSRKNTPINPSR